MDDTPPPSPHTRELLDTAATAVRELRCAQARVLAAVNDLEDVGAAVDTGYGTTERLLGDLVHLDRAEAKALVAQAAMVSARSGLTGQPIEPALPTAAVALTAGRIGREHLAVIMTVMRQVSRVPDLPLEVVEETEHQLADLARGRSPYQLAKAAVEILRRVDQDGQIPTEPGRPDQELHLSTNKDGTLRGRFRITDPETAATVRTALDAHTPPPDTDTSTGTLGRSHAERQAAALHDIAATSLGTPDTHEPDGTQPDPAATHLGDTAPATTGTGNDDLGWNDAGPEDPGDDLGWDDAELDDLELDDLESDEAEQVDTGGHGPGDETELNKTGLNDHPERETDTEQADPERPDTDGADTDWGADDIGMIDPPGDDSEPEPGSPPTAPPPPTVPKPPTVLPPRAPAPKTQGGDAIGLIVTIPLEVLEQRAHERLGYGLLDGQWAISAETARRLACDAQIIPAVLGSNGEPLDIGRKTRIVPTPLRRALITRDHHCAHPGCHRPPRHCRAHHIVPWSWGGLTCLDNLVLLCAFHHHLVHHSGWTIDMRDHVPVFTPPAWLDPARTPLSSAGDAARRDRDLNPVR